MSLTRKQSELLTFIDGYIKENACAPSYDEMTAALSLASKSGVNRLIESLEARGYIRRIPRRARAIEIIRRVGDPPRFDPIRTALAELVATKRLKDRDGDTPEYRSRRDAAWDAAFEALGIRT